MSAPPPRAAVVVGTRASALARARPSVCELLEGAARPLVRGPPDRHARRPDAGERRAVAFDRRQGPLHRGARAGAARRRDRPRRALAQGPPDRGGGRVALGAVCLREDVRDCLVSRGGAALAGLAGGAIVGTSSLRRSAQLRALRPDLEVARSAATSTPASARSATASSTRAPRRGRDRRASGSGRGRRVARRRTMLPAPGQGALAVQCRAATRRRSSSSPRSTTRRRGHDDCGARVPERARRRAALRLSPPTGHDVEVDGRRARRLARRRRGRTGLEARASRRRSASGSRERAHAAREAILEALRG